MVTVEDASCLSDKKITWSLRLPVHSAAADCTYKLGNWSTGNWEIRKPVTEESRSHVKNQEQILFFCCPSVGWTLFSLLEHQLFWKKRHRQILVSFHFQSETHPSFLRPVWKQRRQGQSTDRQKLEFFLLLSPRFTTVMEFPTSHWCLVLSCPVSLKKKVHVAICFLMLTSYQKPAEHLVASPGAMVLLDKIPAPGHLRLKALQFPVTLSLHHTLLFRKYRWYLLSPPWSVLPVLGLSAPSSRNCLQWHVRTVFSTTRPFFG